MFSNINNVFQPINTCLVTVADKQGIHLKMHEMAILETLKFKKVYVLGGGGGARPQIPQETCAFCTHTNKYDQHLGFSNLGSMRCFL